MRQPAFPAHDGGFEGQYALAYDRDDIEAFLHEHGTNQWNHLPKDDVHAYLSKIPDNPYAILAFETGTDTNPLGVVAFDTNRRFRRYQPKGRGDELQGYVSEIVVARDRVGLGVGTVLLGAAIEALEQLDMVEIYALRDSANVASARIMEKCGMKVIDEFDDLEIRASGSGITTVTRRLITT